MREIKLKAWLKEEKIMIDVSEIDFHGEEVSGFDESDVFYEGYGYDYAELMQYTGLKDKNGDEIYKGDIVRCICPEGSFIAVVEFGNPNGLYSWGWQLKPIGRTNFNPDILLWVETELDHVTCEIIGNIHDNPEMVEVKNEQN